MKRNLVLGALLAGLLGVVWYRQHREQEVSGVFGTADWVEVVAMEIPGVVLKKGEDGWVVSDTGRKVDVEKVRELWRALARVRTERDITDQDILRGEAFPRDSDRFVIGFDGRRLEILLGSKLHFDRSFYLETVDVRNGRESIRRWIARDTSSEPGIYNVKTVHRSPAKYRRLKFLLQLKADDFYKEKS